MADQRQYFQPKTTGTTRQRLKNRDTAEMRGIVKAIKQMELKGTNNSTDTSRHEWETERQRERKT